MDCFFGYKQWLKVVLISLTKTKTKNVRWRAFFPWLRRDKDEMIIRSINYNYDYINMQLRWRNKTRLKCIKKNKNFTKNLFLFLSKKETKCYCRLLYTPLLRELSCVWLPDKKSSNPRIRASLKDTLSARCFAYFKQSGNQAQALAAHWS